MVPVRCTTGPLLKTKLLGKRKVSWNHEAYSQTKGEFHGFIKIPESSLTCHVSLNSENGVSKPEYIYIYILYSLISTSAQLTTGSSHVYIMPSMHESKHCKRQLKFSSKPLPNKNLTASALDFGLKVEHSSKTLSLFSRRDRVEKMYS